MKIVFSYWGYEDAGSMLHLQSYARVARALGHEVTMYGSPSPKIPLSYSKALDGADALVFVFDWTTWLQHGDRMDWTRLLSAVPRRRRVVVDCDGAYNDPIEIHGDYNHSSTSPRISWAGGDTMDYSEGEISGEASSRSWVRFCDSLTDKIVQPTLRPLRANVGTFLFHIYDPVWESPLDFTDKEWSMVYVGNSKFRWRGMSRLLRAVEPVRDQVGRIALVGEGWAGPIPGKGSTMQNFYCDTTYLKRLGVEPMPPVPFSRVFETMGRAVVNPVLYRPLFEHLGIVTCRMFETLAAGTIPLFLLDEGYVRELYGDRAMELHLGGERPHEKVLDVLARPDHYAEIVREIRQGLARRHSPEARFAELLEIIRS